MYFNILTRTVIRSDKMKPNCPTSFIRSFQWNEHLFSHKFTDDQTLRETTALSYKILSEQYRYPQSYTFTHWSACKVLFESLKLVRQTRSMLDAISGQAMPDVFQFLVSSPPHICCRLYLTTSSCPLVGDFASVCSYWVQSPFNYD